MKRLANALEWLLQIGVRGYPGRLAGQHIVVGIVCRVEPRAVGRGITAMGGGRTAMEDRIDPSVGFLIAARVGDRVRRGDLLATILARDSACALEGRAALEAAFVIGDEAAQAPTLVSHRVTARGVEAYVRGPALAARPA